MTNKINYLSQNKTARFAGIMFLFCLIFPTLNGIFILFKLNIAGNVVATAKNIMTNELLFRFAIVNGIIIAFSGIILALSLYNLFKSINNNLALFALLMKIVEAVLIIIIEIFGFIALQIINIKVNTFTPEQLQFPVGYFLNIHTDLAASFPMLFLGLGLTVFNYLFFKSKYIPGIFAVFGILSYALIFIYSLINILIPDLGIIQIIQFICWAPSVLFELLIGIWLLIKGIKVQQVLKNV